MSVKDEYLKWRRHPQIGCKFAGFLAGRFADFGQRLEIVTASTPARAARSIALRVERAVADKGVAALALVFPSVTDIAQLAEMFVSLRAHANWSVRASSLPGTAAGDLVAVHVVRDIPFGDATCPSEVLVFGPIDIFPSTRRAPMSAMELYVGEPMASDPKYNRPTVQANLAHMRLNLPTRRAFDNMWENSRKGRLNSLGGEDARAKAKVSFVIGADLAARLGLRP